MSVVSKPGRVQEGVIAQAGIGNQICPLDDFDDAPEFPLKLVDAASAVRRRPPCARMHIKPANNIGDNITIENAVVRDAHPSLLEILDLAVCQWRSKNQPRGGVKAGHFYART